MVSNKQLAILCVDDEEIVLKSLVMQMRDFYNSKYFYEIATSGEEALDVIGDLIGEGVHTILVISDWLMPGMKGDEFLTRVHELYPATIKIMLTGHADPQAVQNAKDNADLFSCVRKPWDKETFFTIIEDALASKTTQSALGVEQNA